MGRKAALSMAPGLDRSAGEVPPQVPCRPLAATGSGGRLVTPFPILNTAQQSLVEYLESIHSYLGIPYGGNGSVAGKELKQ